MQSPFNFIVKPVNGKRYENTKKVGDLDLIVNTSEEDHRFSNRYAEVIAVPMYYNGDVSVGDILLVHHNVFKYYNDMKGNQRSSWNFFMDDMFFVEEDQFFLYKHDDKWRSHGRFCFVKPIQTKQTDIYKPVSEEPLMGTIKYSNYELESMGINEGDEICFKPDSEYEFHVEQEKLYRMFTSQIAIKL